MHKIRLFSSFCPIDIVHLKILQCDWQRVFWLISQKPDFSQIWDLCRNIATNIHFYYRGNSEQSNQTFQQIQKALYLANLWGKKVLYKKLGCYVQIYIVSKAMPKI